MARICEICGKRPFKGYSITRRGLARRKGGVGRKITGRNRRVFKPNLQRVRAVVEGEVVRRRVCTSCIQRGRVIKPA